MAQAGQAQEFEAASVVVDDRETHRVTRARAKLRAPNRRAPRCLGESFGVVMVIAVD